MMTGRSSIQDMSNRSDDTKAKKRREREHEKCSYGDVYCSETSIIEKGFIKDDPEMSRSGERVISGYFYASPRQQIHSAAAKR